MLAHGSHTGRDGSRGSPVDGATVNQDKAEEAADSLNQSFGADLKQFGSQVVDATTKLGSQIGKRTARVYRGAKDSVTEVADSVAQNVKSVSEVAKDTVVEAAQKGLAWMAAPPLLGQQRTAV